LAVADPWVDDAAETVDAEVPLVELEAFTAWSAEASVDESAIDAAFDAAELSPLAATDA
jgi:hypothetical protein